MSILKDFFNHGIHPFEDMTFNKEAAEANERLNEYFKTVDENCNEENNIPFSEKIGGVVSELETLSAEQGFIKGFSLGMRFAVEGLSEKS